MSRVFVCNECAPELSLDTPTSLGHYIQQTGRCHHVDELIKAEIEKAKASEAHQSDKKGDSEQMQISHEQWADQWMVEHRIAWGAGSREDIIQMLKDFQIYYEQVTLRALRDTLNPTSDKR